MKFNSISTVRIWNMTYLTDLNLEKNQLTELPSSIWNLTELQNLNLSQNNNLGDLNYSFKGYSTTSKTATVVDTTWDWTPDTNMTIKWDWNNYVVITTWN